MDSAKGMVNNMMIKYRINEVAKDLNVSNKDVINVLAEKFGIHKHNLTLTDCG